MPKPQPTLTQRLKTAMRSSQYEKAVVLLGELPHDEVLETLIVVFDEVAANKRKLFLSHLNSDLLEDTQVMDMLGMLDAAA